MRALLGSVLMFAGACVASDADGAAEMSGHDAGRPPPAATAADSSPQSVRGGEDDAAAASPDAHTRQCCQDCEPPPPACACRGTDARGERQPLACAECEAQYCPESLAAYAQWLCAHDRPNHVNKGCGKVSVGDWPGLGGRTYVFDAASGALVGLYEFSDVVFGRCCTFDYLFGEGLFPMEWERNFGPASVCPSIEPCNLCPTDGGAPSCF